MSAGNSLAGQRCADVSAGLPACRRCGCTDNAACGGGCSWIEDDLCSHCGIRGHRFVAFVGGALDGELRLITLPIDDGEWYTRIVPPQTWVYHAARDLYVLRKDSDVVLVGSEAVA